MSNILFLIHVKGKIVHGHVTFIIKILFNNALIPKSVKVQEARNPFIFVFLN